MAARSSRRRYALLRRNLSDVHQRAAQELVAFVAEIGRHRRAYGANVARGASAADTTDAMNVKARRLSVQVRPARPDEGERLREIARESKGYWGYDAERVTQWASGLDLAMARRDKEIYVAEVDGQAVGWSALISRGDVCWLDDLWIAPEWIQKGVGTRLFRHASNRARQLGARRMEWEAERHALGFYEKMGGRYLRDGEPGSWGRVSPVFGVDLAVDP